MDIETSIHQIFQAVILLCGCVFLVGGMIGRYQVCCSNDTDKDLKEIKSILRRNAEQSTKELSKIESGLKPKDSV